MYKQNKYLPYTQISELINDVRNIKSNYQLKSIIEYNLFKNNNINFQNYEIQNLNKLELYILKSLNKKLIFNFNNLQDDHQKFYISRKFITKNIYKHLQEIYVQSYLKIEKGTKLSKVNEKILQKKERGISSKKQNRKELQHSFIKDYFDQTDLQINSYLYLPQQALCICGLTQPTSNQVICPLKYNDINNNFLKLLLSFPQFRHDAHIYLNHAFLKTYTFYRQKKLSNFLATVQLKLQNIIEKTTHKDINKLESKIFNVIDSYLFSGLKAKIPYSDQYLELMITYYKHQVQQIYQTLNIENEIQGTGRPTIQENGQEILKDFNQDTLRYKYEYLEHTLDFKQEQ